MCFQEGHDTFQILFNQKAIATGSFDCFNINAQDLRALFRLKIPRTLTVVTHETNWVSPDPSYDPLNMSSQQNQNFIKSALVSLEQKQTDCSFTAVDIKMPNGDEFILIRDKLSQSLQVLNPRNLKIQYNLVKS